MADEVLEELNEIFAAGYRLDEDVVAELQSIMKIYGLSVQDMFFKWESYIMKMEKPGMKVNMVTIRAFKHDLQDALERSARSHATNIKTEKRASATPRAAAKGGDVFGMLDGLVPITPGSVKFNKTGSARKLQTPHLSKVKQEPASSPTTALEDHDTFPTSFKKRPNPDTLIHVLNNHIPPQDPPICPFSKARIQLRHATERKKLGYKNLSMKLSDVSEILSDRIGQFRDWVQEHHKIPDGDFGSAAEKGINEVIAVGRIACDSLEGKLNAASVVLEMPRGEYRGYRVHLDMSNIRCYSVFPGQIIAARGINSSGDKFVVSEILDIPLLPFSASHRWELEEERQRMRGEPEQMDEDEPIIPLSILIASGPYTADENLDFEPLHELCKVADSINADGMILLGPFIDIDHPLIATGDFDLPSEEDPDTATMETVFRHFVSPAINDLVRDNPSITIVLVPSVRDVLNKHVSWPQEELSKKGLGLPKQQVKMAGNPMMVLMNEILIGLSSQDVLRELKEEELCTRSKGEDALARLSGHLVEQRHFFPLFPPADRRRGGARTGAMLDTGYLKLGEMVDSRPDVLVVPSALPAFAKKIMKSVIVINPGYLSKTRGAAGGGTYAKLTILAPKPIREGENSNEKVSHNLFERARVEVRSI